jgi:hypothetical protein
VDPRQKTSSHLERMILSELRRHALCASVAAITVRATADGHGWEIADIQAPGGVSRACRAIALAAADELRQRYDLLPERDLAPDDELRMID